jgi:hypothetical protein
MQHLYHTQAYHHTTPRWRKQSHLRDGYTQWQIRSLFVLHALLLVILYRLTSSTPGVVKHDNYAVRFIMPSPLRTVPKLQPSVGHVFVMDLSLKDNAGRIKYM